MLAIERVLEQLDYILINSIFCGETFRPREEKALVSRRLFDGEGEGKTQRYCRRFDIKGVWFGWRPWRFRVGGKEGIDRIGEVI
jgi:hypothetical protein